MTNEDIAIQFHNIYEKLAPQFGYATREDTKEFDPDSPNGRLMIAVCGELQEILTQGAATLPGRADGQ